MFETSRRFSRFAVTFGAIGERKVSAFVIVLNMCYVIRYFREVCYSSLLKVPMMFLIVENIRYKYEVLNLENYKIEICWKVVYEQFRKKLSTIFVSRKRWQRCNTVRYMIWLIFIYMYLRISDFSYGYGECKIWKTISTQFSRFNIFCKFYTIVNSFIRNVTYLLSNILSNLCFPVSSIILYLINWFYFLIVTELASGEYSFERMNGKLRILLEK